jgi:dipeptide/tripeptide permease
VRKICILWFDCFCFTNNLGFKTILALYLVDFLKFTEDTATTTIHTFVFLAYFFPLMGGALADTLLGKFWTIAILSLVYCVGQVLIAVTAIPGVTGNPTLPSTHSKGHPPHWWGVAIGLVLVAIGTGGIKPCVSSFGGDQFRKDQGDLVSSYFAMFYLSINIGSTISSFLTPLLSDSFGYAVAFAVPAVLLLIAVVIFFAGYKTYTMVIELFIH